MVDTSYWLNIIYIVVGDEEKNKKDENEKCKLEQLYN